MQKPNLSIPEKWAYQYFENLFKKSKHSNQHQPKVFYAPALQKEKLQLLRQKSLVYAGCLGGGGILSLYLPYWFFPNIFPYFYMDLPFMPHTQIPYAYLLYGAFLAILEIVLLVRLNLYMVFQMSQICSTEELPVDVQELEMLFAVGMEKPATQLLDFGIDPHIGLSKWQLILFSTLNMLKATLSNIFIKMVLSRILGRLTLRFAFLKYLIDLLSVPIFAFWDIYATNRVFVEAKIRLFAPQKIQAFIQEIPHETQSEAKTKEILLDMLQYIAIAKRSFHQNHYLLAAAIVKHFELSPHARPSYTPEQEILTKIKDISPASRLFLAKLLYLGLVIDGYASYRDYRILQRASQFFAQFDDGYVQKEIPFLWQSWEAFKQQNF